MGSTSYDKRKAHDSLDPKKVAGPGSPVEGQNIRESRDSDEHPNATPITVWFDETGSMGNTPRVLQTKLTTLFGLLLRKGYVEDPQILMGAYGDGTCDYVALQAGQFESDNRIDDTLDNIYLEGNGGGNFGESQWLAWYFTAYHTVTDAWEKREKKGYAFFIGDECSLTPDARQVEKWVGDKQPMWNVEEGEDIAQAVVNDLLEKWEAYVFVIDNHAAAGQKSVEKYSALFGKERVLVVQDENAIAETIALTIGMTEGVIDLDDGVDDLKDAGVDAATIAKATSALTVYKNGGSGAVVAADAPEDLEDADTDSVSRL